MICSLRKSLLPGRKILLEENIINYVHKEKENQGWLFILISEDFVLSFISAEMYFSKVVSLWANFRKVGAAEITKSYRYRIPNRNNNPIFFFFFLIQRVKKKLNFSRYLFPVLWSLKKFQDFTAIISLFLSRTNRNKSTNQATSLSFNDNTQESRKMSCRNGSCNLDRSQGSCNRSNNGGNRLGGSSCSSGNYNQCKWIIQLRRLGHALRAFLIIKLLMFKKRRRKKNYYCLFYKTRVEL